MPEKAAMFGNRSGRFKLETPRSIPEHRRLLGHAGSVLVGGTTKSIDYPAHLLASWTPRHHVPV